MSAPILEVRDLRHAFGRQLALDGLSLRLEPGIHGLLGPNGAGKSTLLKVLLALLRPDAGSGEVLGHPLAERPREVRHRLGYMPERDCHLPGMVALDYVALMGELSGLPRVAATRRAHEVLTYVGLSDARHRVLDGFSAGMKQRAKLASALVHDPDLLLLDEPSNGLDPAGRRDMLRLIRELGRTGISIVLSTHLLPDVQAVCDGVAVLLRGRLLRQGPVAELTGREESVWRIRVQGDPEALRTALLRGGLEAELDPASGEIRATLGPHQGSREIFAAAVGAHVGIRTLRPAARTLEEAFFALVDGADHAHP
jgi:ABC-2 type transport system ATP-binding protein